MENMDSLMQYLPFLIPLVILQLALMLAALVHLLKHNKYRFGNRVLWVIVVAVFGFVGPILYFTVGRSEE
ncbi:MAG: hypothetical protein K0S04_2501 [Herbinix sp.]|jgi:hypothetical protein|nr:hypothetical protein [Herbinix sp.]